MSDRHGRRIALATLISAAALCGASQAQDRPAELLIYCGTTLVLPISDIARSFEKQFGVKVTISQGASQDLYQSLRKSRVGDLYLPGDPDYRTRHLPEGLLGDYVTLGYNQAALMVRKGNPKQVKPDLKELLRPDLAVAIGSAERGAIGLETRQILERAGIYQQVLRNASSLGAESGSLTAMLKKGEADLTMNFRATAFFPDSVAQLEAIDLPAEVAPPKALWLSLTTVARNPADARRFMQFAAGPQGQLAFKTYGFIVDAAPRR